MAGSRFRGRHVQRGKFLGGVVLRNVLRNVPRVVIKTAKAARPLLTKQGLKTLAKKGSKLAAKKGAEYAAKQAVEITERRKRGEGLRFKGRRMQRGSGGGKLSKKLASVEKTRRRFSIPGI